MTTIDATVLQLMALHDDASEARHVNGAPEYNSIANSTRKLLKAALRAALTEAQPVPPSADGPAELWLQLHGDCLDHELRIPVDYTTGEVTWCWHSINDSDVRYVRADLSQPVQPAQDGYGKTDFGFTFAGVVPSEGAKRLMAMLVDAFGTEHQAVEDLTALIFSNSAQTAQPAAVGAVEQLDKFCTCDDCKPMVCEGCRVNRERRERRAAIASKGTL